MMPLLPERPYFGIFYPQFAVNGNHEPVKGTDHFLCIFLIHITRLVPDHFLSEHRGEFLNFGSPELLGQCETLDMVACPVPCLVGGKREVFCDQHDTGDEPVPELVYHAKMMEGGIKKADLDIP
jgi:hypothetical protein